MKTKSPLPPPPLLLLREFHWRTSDDAVSPNGDVAIAKNLLGLALAAKFHQLDGTRLRKNPCSENRCHENERHSYVCHNVET